MALLVAGSTARAARDSFEDTFRRKCWAWAGEPLSHELIMHSYLNYTVYCAASKPAKDQGGLEYGKAGN